MKRAFLSFLGLALIVLAGALPLSAKKVTEPLKVEPPCWWTGMKTPLQLMIHGQNVSAEKVVSLDKGLVISAIHYADSPNYLFVDIQLDPQSQAGDYRIQVGKQIINYPIYQRKQGSALRKGFGTEDMVYLLMPDRFVNGDPGNDSTPDTKEKADPANPNYLGARQGGDIQGIIDMLDYLQDLGVTAIWSTPMQLDNEERFSYHGYACANHYLIDPRFGSNQLYKEYVEQASQRGIKVIMDMVPNHCGTAHWWMQDLPFEDWIHIFRDQDGNQKYVNSNFALGSISDPHASKYDQDLCLNGWFDYTMADMNLHNPFVMTYFTQYAIWWVEYAGLGGIRVDTYPYTDKNCMAQWITNIMEEYPNFNIVTEAWYNTAAELSYWEGGHTQHDGFDSCIPTIMDFFLTSRLVPAVLKSGQDWANGIGMMLIYEVLAQDFLYLHPENMMIFADNHDTVRLFHSLGKDYNRQKMVLGLLATLRGFPQLYYGDEWGFCSADGTTGHSQERILFPTRVLDPSKRTAEEQDLYDYTRKLFTWRRNAKTIHNGDFMHFRPSDNFYVYFRYNKENPIEKVMVIVNNNTEPMKLDWNKYSEIAQGFAGEEIITGERIKYGQEIEIPAQTLWIVEQ